MTEGGMDREDWIDGDGDDCLPVFVTKYGEKYHRENDGCIDPKFKSLGYDLFAAELDGYDPCQDCFDDDRYVDTDTDRSEDGDQT